MIEAGIAEGTLRPVDPDMAALVGSTPFCTDWVNTTESQRLLNYQRRDLGDYNLTAGILQPLHLIIS